jgi:hypothetical protein
VPGGCVRSDSLRLSSISVPFAVTDPEQNAVADREPIAELSVQTSAVVFPVISLGSVESREVAAEKRLSLRETSPVRGSRTIEGIHTFEKRRRDRFSVQTVQFSFAVRGSGGLESDAQLPIDCSSQILIYIDVGLECICFTDFHLLLPSRMADRDGRNGSPFYEDRKVTERLGESASKNRFTSQINSIRNNARGRNELNRSTKQTDQSSNSLLDPAANQSLSHSSFRSRTNNGIRNARGPPTLIFSRASKDCNWTICQTSG